MVAVSVAAAEYSLLRDKKNCEQQVPNHETVRLEWSSLSLWQRQPRLARCQHAPKSISAAAQ